MLLLLAVAAVAVAVAVVLILRRFLEGYHSGRRHCRMYGAGVSTMVTQLSSRKLNFFFFLKKQRQDRGQEKTNGNIDERSSWSETLRTRAGRAPSLSNITLSGSPTTQNSSQNAAANRQIEQHRAASIAAMEMETPVREIPRQPKHNKPDFFQEKILRGDFMD